jgi:hypothetical protein
MYNLNTDHELAKLQKENAKIWNSIKILNQTTLITRDANIDIQLEHVAPVLINEYYPVKLRIKNREEFPIGNLRYLIFNRFFLLNLFMFVYFEACLSQ